MSEDNKIKQHQRDNTKSQAKDFYHEGTLLKETKIFNIKAK